MRLMKRNAVPIYYCLYKGREPILDEQGYETSEYRLAYEPPVPLTANVSPAKGTAQVEQFGNLESYDKVILTDDMACPIDENTVLFVDKPPEFDPESGEPLYDYTVNRVARSLNVVGIAVSKVKVS